jgi:hypothetical protein
MTTKRLLRLIGRKQRQKDELSIQFSNPKDCRPPVPGTRLPGRCNAACHTESLQRVKVMDGRAEPERDGRHLPLDAPRSRNLGQDSVLWHGLRIELKKAPGGRFLIDQVWWLDRLRAVTGPSSVKGTGQAIKRNYELLSGDISNGTR